MYHHWVKTQIASVRNNPKTKVNVIIHNHIFSRPGCRGVEVCCDGFGPHPALCVHGCVHHRDACRLCWKTHWAQHAVEAWPINEDVYCQNRTWWCIRNITISVQVQVVFGLFLPLSLSCRHKCCVRSLKCVICVFTDTEETAGQGILKGLMI